VIGYAINVSNTAGPALKALGNVLRPQQLRPIVGRSARNAFVAHFRAKNTRSPNRFGARRTNYYLGAARATSFQPVGDGVVISVAQIGIRLHYYGGTVRAGRGISSFSGKPTKFLTIPARAEAHGKRASEFPDLIVLRRGDHQFGEPYALARKVTQSVKHVTTKRLGRTSREDYESATMVTSYTGGEILFWLKREVRVPADPDILPQPLDIGAAIFSDVNKAIDLAWQRKNGGAPNA